MSDYTELKGLKVKYLSSDPSPGTAGDVWYNTTDKKIKSYTGRAAWSAGANLSTVRSHTAGAGIPTAALVIGGNPGAMTTVEEYNGFGWLSGGALNVGAKAHGTAGTQTAALEFGGGPPNKATTEEYDGSSWTESGDLANARRDTSGCGIQTAALCMGGTGDTNATEEYGGATWTAGGDLNTVRPKSHNCGIGTQTAALCAGGSPYLTNVESYDGSSWTEGPDLNGSHESGGTSGNQTSALIFGGGASPGFAVQATTEQYDGTSWSETSDLATARHEGGSTTDTTGGTAGMYIGGNADTDGTEEFNHSFQVVTAGAWSAGGNLNLGRKYCSGFGSLNAGICVGGNNTATANCELYDGSAWAETANLNTARGRHSCTMASPQTAGLAMGGTNPDSPARYDNVEEWNGSSWSEETDLPTDIGLSAGAGTSTAGLIFGGDPGQRNATHEWDGSSWTNGGNLTAGRVQIRGCGTQTAGLAVAGDNTGSSPYVCGLVEEYNGTAWTEVNNTPTDTANHFTAGTQADAHASVSNGVTFGYDGTNWSTRPTMGTARYALGSIGNAAVTTGGAIAIGGTPGDPGKVNAEEFIGATTAVTASVIDFD